MKLDATNLPRCDTQSASIDLSGKKNREYCLQFTHPEREKSEEEKILNEIAYAKLWLWNGLIGKAEYRRLVRQTNQKLRRYREQKP